MKANELMIGDWIYNKNIDKPMQVYPMMFSQMFRQRPDATTEDYNIFPIPLTPEILKKNGFVNKKGRFMQSGNFDNPPLIMWHLVDDKILGHPKSQLEIHHGYKSIHVSFVCDYVHELQHALRLCGIEKEIVL